MNKLILIKFLFFALIIISSCSRKPAIIVDRADFFYNKANSYRYSNSHTSYTNNKDFYIKVKNGDTLSQIAQFYNMSSDKIANANNLKAPYQLKIGSKLKIPKKYTHKVSKGDTLFKISKLYNIKLSSLAKINNLNKPYILKTNQIINIDVKEKPTSLKRHGKKRIATRKVIKNSKKITNIFAKSSSKFSWPLDGRVVSSFGPKKGGLYNDGINIKAANNQIVKASQDGVVAYVGNELKGYGNLIIIKHSGGWITAYAHLLNTNVKKGLEVKKGQKIAIAGATGNVNFNQLYFSLRKGRKAVDPQKYLR